MESTQAPRSTPRFRVVLVVLGLAAVGLAVYLIAGDRSGAATASRSPRPSASPSEAAVVTSRGSLVPIHQAELAMAVTGAVTEILVAPGTAVDAAQPLVRVDGLDQALRVNVAEADVKRAKAALSAATTERSALPNSATGGERRVASAAIAVADAAYRFELANLAAAKAEQARITLLAPFAGTIAAINTEIGEQVGPSDPIITLVDTSAWLTRVTVPESVAVSLAPGDRATVTVGSVGGVSLPANVLTVGPAPEGGSDQLVTLGLSGTDAALRPGLSTVVEFAP